MTTRPDQYLLRTYNWTGNGDPGVTQPLPSGALTPSDGTYTLTYSFLETLAEAEDAGYTSTSNFSYMAHYQYSNFYTANAVQEAVALIVMKQDEGTDYSFTNFFGDVAPVSFALGTASSANITLGQINDTSTAGFYGKGNSADALTYNYNSSPSYIGQSSDASVYGNIWFNKNASIGWSGDAAGSVQFFTVLHEMGHALGLKHPQTDTDGAGHDPNTADDSQQYTMMYDTPQGWTPNPGGPNPYTPTTNALYNGSSTTPLYAYGLQVNDIAAIQDIYGRNYGTRGDNTLYDFGNGLGRDGDASKAFIYAIWDGGGTNIIDTTGFSGAVKIDLRQGEFSSIGSNGNGANGFDPSAGRDIDNVSIAYHTLIQNVITTQDNSVVIGNAWDDVLFASGNNAKIYSDGIAYNNDTGFITGVSGDSSDPNNSIPSIQNDLLIGGSGPTTFYSGLGSNVIVGYYDKSIIDSATSGWSTYWDAAGQFTGSNNATGAALPNVFHDGLTKTADYSNLNASENVALAGGDLHIEYTGTATSATVDKDTASACVGTDQLFDINHVVGTDGSDIFSGTYAGPSYTTFSASKGVDSYDFTTGFGVDYSSLASLSGAHVTLTADASGMTVDKYDSSGAIGEDTIVTTTAGQLEIAGTGGNDSFTGFDPNTFGTTYFDTGSNNSFTFDLNTFDSTATINNIHFGIGVWEDGSGSPSDVHLANFDSGTMTTGAILGAETASGISVDIWAQKFNSALGVHTEFDVYFYQVLSGPGVQSFTVGATNYEFGGYYSDIITGASGDHTIDGGGGTNTIDYSAATGGITANLNTGAVSNNGWGYTDTLHDISVIVGSHHNDNITGDGSTTTVSYADAASGVTVSLSAGTATGDGSDTLSGVPNVIGSSHDDFITSSSGDNVIDGGAGSNTVSYAAASSSVTVDLSAGIATGDGNDTLINIQNVIGSPNDGDTLAGNSGDNTLDGGGGDDTVSYQSASSAVTVNLLTGTATGDGNDTLLNIGSAIGSQYDDTLTGSGFSNLYGMAGNDTLYGGGTAHYDLDPAGVTVNLATGTAIDGWGDTDTLIGIERVTGSQHNDIITADSSDDYLFGAAGNDTFVISTGFGNTTVSENTSSGTDTIHFTGIDPSHIRMYTDSYGDLLLQDTTNPSTHLTVLAYTTGSGTNESEVGEHVEQITFDDVNNTVWSLTGGLTLTGTTSAETLYGTAYGDVINGMGGADTIYGNGGDDTISSGSGNDILDGGTGTDTLSYSGATAAVTVNLATTSAQNTVGAGTDTITNFENLSGSAFADTLTGDGNANVIDGGAGNDVMNGAGGTDTLSYASATAGITISLAVSTGQATGGSGTDTISNFENLTGSGFADTLTGDGNANVIDGGTGNDLIQGGAGNDVLTGGLGTDTVTYATAASAVTVNLSTTTGQNTVGAGTDTISGFENLTGSAFNDTLTGDGNDNVIEGLAGNDSLVGGAGTDTVTYVSATAGVTVNLATTTGQNTVGAGTDTISGFENLTGSAFNDTLTGDGNNNVIEGLAGNDVMNGAGGTDTLTYASATAAITISLAIATAQATGGAGSDTISNFENLTGSAFDDTLTGDANANVVDGGAGNDIIQGGAGNDVLIGGLGTDTLTYAAAASAVTVNLATTSAQVTGGAGTDTVSGFENLTGSGFADTLTGDANANTISGGAGNDIIAGSGGADVLDGGAGTDTVDYSAAAAGVTVNLGTGTASNDGDGSSDTLTTFENITGSAYDDILTGDANANAINGGAGNDLIQGGAGNDVLTGGADTDTVTYSAATAGVTVNLTTTTGQNTVGAGTDTISGFENLTGSGFADTLTGDGNNNVIQGLAGNDVLVGGSGTDTVTYVDAASAVTVSLATTSAQNTVGAGTDTISGFENLTGSAFDDILTGDANANVLQGLAGNDLLSGGAGNDSLDGGGGTDTATFASAAAGVTIDLSAGTATGDGSDTLTNIENVTGSTHNDVITGNSGNNLLDGGAGNDSLDGGGGTDTVTYASSSAGVTVDLYAGTATGNGSDTLTNIENVIGSTHNDTIVSGSGDNVLDGGSGTDTISYASAASHVTIDLSAGTVTGDGTDTLSNFENIIGSAYDDTITGNSSLNTINGGAGNDTIDGGGAPDLLYGGTGSDTFLFLTAHLIGPSAKIEDFTNGSGNDKIDIKDVISGYDPATMAITDWVQITTSGSDSLLKVDIDGGTTHTWQQIATIVGVTGLTDEAALVASGNLVVH